MSRTGAKPKPSVGTDAMCLVGMGLFANSLAPWLQISSGYGNLMVTGGVGLIAYEVYSNYKSKIEKLFINCGLYIKNTK